MEITLASWDGWELQEEAQADRNKWHSFSHLREAGKSMWPLWHSVVLCGTLRRWRCVGGRWHQASEPWPVTGREHWRGRGSALSDNQGFLRSASCCFQTSTVDHESCLDGFWSPRLAHQGLCYLPLVRKQNIAQFGDFEFSTSGRMWGDLKVLGAPCISLS